MSFSVSDPSVNNSSIKNASKTGIEPGPPNFGEFEGGATHHPGASTVPGAGPNPTAAEPDKPPRDTGRTTPGASNTPGAGPNPDPGE
jgi:hypothetical protein